MRSQLVLVVGLYNVGLLGLLIHVSLSALSMVWAALVSLTILRSLATC